MRPDSEILYFRGSRIVSCYTCMHICYALGYCCIIVLVLALPKAGRSDQDAVNNSSGADHEVFFQKFPATRPPTHQTPYLPRGALTPTPTPTPPRSRIICCLSSAVPSTHDRRRHSHCGRVLPAVLRAPLREAHRPEARVSSRERPPIRSVKTRKHDRYTYITCMYDSDVHIIDAAADQQPEKIEVAVGRCQPRLCALQLQKWWWETGFIGAVDAVYVHCCVMFLLFERTCGVLLITLLVYTTCVQTSVTGERLLDRNCRGLRRMLELPTNRQVAYDTVRYKYTSSAEGCGSVHCLAHHARTLLGGGGGAAAATAVAASLSLFQTNKQAHTKNNRRTFRYSALAAPFFLIGTNIILSGPCTTADCSTFT